VPPWLVLVLEGLLSRHLDSGSLVTIRDPAGGVIATIPPVTAVRLGGGMGGFPEATPKAATPTS
jgi:hypothetical protein